MAATTPVLADLDPSQILWRRLASEFVSELLSLPDADARARRVRELAQAESPMAVARALLGEARACARSDTARAATLLGYAVLAAEQLDPTLYPPGVWAGLFAAAYCRVGDAFRVARCYPEAEAAFARAAGYLASLSDDLEPRARYLESLSRLRRDQKRAGEAEDLLRQADILREALAHPEPKRARP